MAKKAHELAAEAIRDFDKKKAEALCLNWSRLGWSMPRINEYLAAHGIDLDEWDELLRAI